MKRFLVPLLALCVTLPIRDAGAAEPLTGEQIARKIYDRDVGRNMYSENEMVLIDRTGAMQTRVMVQMAKKEDGLIKNYMRFTEPSAIAGTTFLSWEVKGKDDKQFIFLPELGRERRIVSSQKDGDFVNTDFSFEDMERRHFDRDQHKLLREEMVGGVACWVLESNTRINEESQYGRRLMWISMQSLLAMKGELYSRKTKRLLRKFTAKKTAQVDGIWTMMEGEMVNVERDHRTIWRVRKVSYNRGVNDRVFTRAYMKIPR